MFILNPKCDKPKKIKSNNTILIVFLDNQFKHVQFSLAIYFYVPAVYALITLVRQGRFIPFSMSKTLQLE
ncbi:protein of unknown function [Candidatus Nitrosocosmicus franklandus]|uniref:Uncharacterized protein n=1 Tax=Candidatus Nitrosocosmicus franklandianus TaxID=1798806 RepID=A0A484IHK4_9ARCH|nr:protein of unknown function [Candidatus Nitrosocosmicus franklandus]